MDLGVSHIWTPKTRRRRSRTLRCTGGERYPCRRVNPPRGL
jgi:hypothetical protein